MPLPRIEPPLINSAVTCAPVLFFHICHVLKKESLETNNPSWNRKRSNNPTHLNLQNPWATTEQDLQILFDCPYTGAVTTRTGLLEGFEHNDAIHQYAFFDPNNHTSSKHEPPTKDTTIPSNHTASLNTLGYSPHPLATYLAAIANITTPSQPTKAKPFIISVTGSAQAVAESYRRISAAQQHDIQNPLCMEINLSCPNIPDKPPPAYSKTAMLEYLDALDSVRREIQDQGAGPVVVPVGVKTPPYTYHDQFQTLISALLETKCAVDFITATNTLGSSLLLSSTDFKKNEYGTPALCSASGAGVGGMAGAPLHPLALGNVKTIRGLLDSHERLRGVEVIGVGGVSDRAGFERMRAVGAGVVGVGTALGRDGVDVFERILEGGARDV